MDDLRLFLASAQLSPLQIEELVTRLEGLDDIQCDADALTSHLKYFSIGDPAGDPASDSAADNDGEHSRQGFSRPGNKGNNNQKSGSTPSPGGTPYQSSSNLAPRVPPLPNSPSFASSLTGATAMDEGVDDKQFKFKEPLWYKEKWTHQVVKGNFMTIVARPKIVEDGEWLAHQVSEMYRMLSTITKILVDPEDPSCNVCVPQTCPTMSAGTHTYTWLDSNRQPTKLPAPQYINLVQKWVVNKLSDTKSFPTDQNTVFASGNYPSGSLDSPNAGALTPAGQATPNAPLQTLGGRTWVGKMSGFPETHLQDCKNLLRQMFRVYAHIYWNHFTDLYHLKMETALNSAFTYFIFFVREFDLLTAQDLEPMQRIIDIWTKQCYVMDRPNASGSVTYIFGY